MLMYLLVNETPLLFTVEHVLFCTPQVAKRGEIKRVKVLGCLAMIDEGTTSFLVQLLW